MKWTKEEEKLLEEYASKYVTKTIAKKLNRSIAAIRHKANTLNIKLNDKKDPWKKWMLYYLKDNYDKKKMKELKEMLRLTEYEIKKKAKELGIYKPKKQTWTEEEVNILKELASKVYIKEIAKVLNKTEAAVIKKAYSLELDYITIPRVYTEEEYEYVKNNWGKLSINQIARDLKVSRMAVNAIANKMNLPHLGQNIKWTDEVIANLRKDALKMSTKELSKKYKTTISQISTIAYRNNIKLIDGKVHWSDEDNELLKKYATYMTKDEIAKKMNRSIGAVSQQLRRKNIKPVKQKRNRKGWSIEELEELKELVASGKPTNEIAKQLDRTENSIQLKMRKLNITSPNLSKRKWTKEDTQLLIDWWGDHSMENIAKKLNRSVSSIKNKAFLLKLGSQIENNFDGLRIQEIADIFKISRVNVENWIILGLKYKTKRISDNYKYRYVELDKLLAFLEKNQNIWDSRELETYILGTEPDWLKEKRKRDMFYPLEYYGIENLNKQLLINEDKYYLKDEIIQEKGYQKVLKK